MNTKRILLKVSVFTLAIVFGATWCFAQQAATATQTTIQGLNTLGGGYESAYGDSIYPYVNGRALTPDEAYGRGIGDIIRSEGVYNLLSSQAAINATEAVRNSIQNRELATSTYYQLRRMQKSYVAEERGPRPTSDDFSRYAQMDRPRALGPNELDAASGKIYWPRAFRSDQFTAYRTILDELFAKRARYGDISMDDVVKIRDVVTTMIDLLKEQIRIIPAMEYTSAKQFLASLAYEVRVVAG
jgi:hypothetical protein